MRSVMSFGERFSSGFALAATIAGDPGAERACAGLHDSLREPATQVARELLTLSKAARRARVGALARQERKAWPTEARSPLRAYGLLARSEQASTLPRFVHAAPLPRAGFTPEPGLVRLLRRIAFQLPDSQALAAAQPPQPERGEPWGA